MKRTEVGSSLLFLVLTLLSWNTHSQSLVGRVVSSVDKRPITDATVVLLGTTRGTFTNGAGYFELEGIQTGNTIIISHVGFQAGEVVIKELNSVLIKLSPKVVKIEPSFLIDDYEEESAQDLFQENELILDDLKEEVEEIFTIVESNAAYVGGWTQFYSELAQSIFKSTHQFKPTSSFNIQFVLEGNGNIRDINMSDTSFSDIIGFSIKELDNWIPAIQNGRKVDQYISFNVSQSMDSLDEKAARFPGGIKGFHKYLSKNLKYPREAQRQGLQGVVTVEFIVEVDGSLSGFNIVNSKGPSLDKEALRVIEGMPNWIPGEKNKKSVRQKIQQNVIFGFEGTPFEEIDLTKASFPGGNSAFKIFVRDNMTKIKTLPKPNKYKNSVRVEFEVDTLGNITNGKLLNSLGAPFDQEALRLVDSMPKWIPASNGRTKIQDTRRVSISFDRFSNTELLYAKDLYKRGVEFYAKGLYERALKSFSKAIKINPTEVDYYFNRSCTLIQMGNLEEACDDLILIKGKDEQANKLYLKHCVRD